MEFNYSNIPHRTLSDAITARIELATLTIANELEYAKIQASVDMLNADMVEAGIIGEEIFLQSSLLMRTRSVFDPKRGEYIAFPSSHLSDEQSAKGTFVGFEQYTSQDKTFLMYKINTSSNDGLMSFDAITAPVEDSVLDLVLEDEEAQSYSESEIYKNLNKLSEIEDPKFQEYIRAFIETIESGEEENASFFAELGIIATWMLAHDEVRLVTNKRQTIITIFELLISKRDYYFIAGHDLIGTELNGRRSAVIDVIEAFGLIEGVELISDYRVNLEMDTMEILETSQPAFILSGESKYYMPLRHLTEFREGHWYDGSCNASMNRYKKFVLQRENQ